VRDCTAGVATDRAAVAAGLDKPEEIVI